jgi:Flp pilus assembly protein CpaB
MRASLLAVIAIAIVAGLAVVFAVKSLGLLEQPKPPEQVVVVKDPPPPAPPASPPIVVLAPVRHIFKGDAISGENVAARILREDEREDYEKNKADYMVGDRDAALWRLAAKDLPGGRPLRKGDLDEAKRPEPLSTRLFPGTRAVTIGIPKDHSASGLIQVGDWVDVYVSTDVGRTDTPASSVPYTALLVPHALVVAKRDTLYPIYDPLRSDTIPFTLATNPYRAALLEHGRTVGTLTLVPVSSDEKKRLDELRDTAMKNPGSSSVAATFAAQGSPEYQAEEDRIKNYVNGSLSIGDDTLVKLLKLPVIEPLPPPPKPPKPPKPVKPQPVPPPPPPVTIEVYSGSNRTNNATFPVPYDPPPPPVIPDPPEPPEPEYVPPPLPKYYFRNPDAKPKAPAK